MGGVKGQPISCTSVGEAVFVIVRARPSKHTSRTRFHPPQRMLFGQALPSGFGILLPGKGRGGAGAGAGGRKKNRDVAPENLSSAFRSHLVGAAPHPHATAGDNRPQMKHSGGSFEQADERMLGSGSSPQLALWTPAPRQFGWDTGVSQLSFHIGYSCT
ncbi:hypothetical protein SKAU_G00090980 [Synaphobranchus kaupii]|uniref:Uncharacterized protein n=1 Tax=Synaphobranchus kaupii TaxID=118154 RepID=A0A9Q1FXI7_SYNKA|nr:hypothetical protein SKAU_G00090980 [Synaphobranchus kaupii]